MDQPRSRAELVQWIRALEFCNKELDTKEPLVIQPILTAPEMVRVETGSDGSSSSQGIAARVDSEIASVANRAVPVIQHHFTEMRTLITTPLKLYTEQLAAMDNEPGR